MWLYKRRNTLECRQVAAKLKHLLEGVIILLLGFLDIDRGESVGTPLKQFLALLFVPSVGEHL